MNNNENFVLPHTFLIGYTTANMNGLTAYLEYTGQLEFLKEVEVARASGLDWGEILCSFYAKLCYASLTDKKNKNISKIRSIEKNLEAILDTGHGSVIEHCWINFVTTDCSRVFTHELVRHRVGTAFSQTSGRYVRSDVLKLVIDPILEPIYTEIEYLRQEIEERYKEFEERMLLDVTDFDRKKKITSALRRVLPNGQANEMGFSVNLRTLRHTIEARTSRHAEWEIRVIFNQVYDLLALKYAEIFGDAKFEMVDGLREIAFKNKKI